MGKTEYMKLKGIQNFRLRLVLSTLSSTPILIDDIRSESTWPGLRPYEVSFLRLIEKISDDCSVEINETGTKLKYKPGILMGGKYLQHDCGTSRAMGYFLEALILLGLFGKRSLNIKLKGITNDAKDPSVDTFQSTAFPILSRFGVDSEGLNLKIERRGVPPLGGGEIILSVPAIPDSLKAVTWIDEGLVRRIRGVAFSTRVSVHVQHAMIQGVRSIFNNMLPDVRIDTDHAIKERSAKSPGYGISLHALTTSDCVISVDTAVCRGSEELKIDDDEDNTDRDPPDVVGVQIASALVAEIERGGVVDSTHQGLLFLLCALCPQDVSKVRVGKLSPYAIDVLRNIRDFLHVKFVITPDPATGTVILKCVGSGLKNLSRKVS